MSSLFKKRKNLNIRHRRTDDDEDGEDNENLETASTGSHFEKNKDPLKINVINKSDASKKEKKKTKDKADKKITVLSFEDELEADDGITFQEKKSSLSYKLRKEMKKERKEKKKEEKLKNEGRDKTKEKNTSGVRELDDLGIRIVNGREAEIIALQPGDSDDEPEITGPVFRPKKKSVEKATLHPWKEALQDGKIPDANLIHEIRKQRQKARERSDFIPVDDTVRLEESNSRLIREDDNDHSEDEDRLKFSVNQEETDRKQRREAFEAAQAERAESDHDSEWELQQLKKAGAAAKLASDAVEGLKDLSMDNNIQGAYFRNGMPGSAFSSYSSATAEPAWGSLDSIFPQSTLSLPRPVNYQAEGITKRLKESRASLDEVVRRHRSEADSVIDNLVIAKSTISKCSIERDPQKEYFKFYQDTRGYVTDLRECLNEKMSEIKKLEEQISLLYRQRTQKIIYRRRQDVKDQNNEFSPFAGKLAKGDEYRIRRSAEREGRRTRRRRERERRGDVKHHDGMSTDDEEVQSEQNLISAELANIASEGKKIFEDVEDEFAQLQRVMIRFEKWRKIDPSSYNDAYVSHNLPKIFAAYIRLNLLMWNPLKKDEDTIDIERMTWFHYLFLYALDANYNMNLEEFRTDPDRNLTSHIVEKIILNKLKDLVSCSWDPLSHTQSVRLVNLVRHYAITYPTIGPNSKPLKELTQTIISKIKDSIENDVFVPMFPKNVYENKTSGVSLFFQRQFWSAWKLLGTALMWHRILSDEVIHDLAIRSLLNLYLLPALNLAAEINVSDALEKTRNVINVLPREWSKKDGGAHAFLSRLEAFLVALAPKLDPATHSPELKEICDLLLSVGAKSRSEAVADKYL